MSNKRIQEAANEMLKALEEFEIEECNRCNGSGMDEMDEHSACTRCGGCGEVLIGGWPEHVRAAIKKATGRVI